jgi:hypothetical protein
MASTVVTNHLAFATVPADVTADATGPHGVVVSYPVPAVTDTGNPNPPVATCTPSSGALFPIGTTTVACSAADPDATPATVSISFDVTVEGAAAQLADPHQLVQGLRAGWLVAGQVAAAERQVSGRHPVELPGEMARAQAGPAREVGHGQRPVQAPGRPVQQVGERIAVADRDGGRDELGLAAGAVGRHDKTAGQGVGDRRAMVDPHATLCMSESVRISSFRTLARYPAAGHHCL